MADSGRPRKPTNLAVLHGDRGDRINRNEPVPAEGEIAPPWELTADGQEVWDRLAPDRIAKGVLTSWDVDAFAFTCEMIPIAKSKLATARRKATPGAASPMSELKTAMSILTSLGGRFGWTPSDRAGLVVKEAEHGEEWDMLAG